MNASQLTVRVAHKQAEASDIWSFELVEMAGRALPPLSAGSHIDVRLPDGITRQYSLCNDPSERHRYLIAVLKDAASRGGSRAMHNAVQEGDLLQISTPRNHFPLVPDARTNLLFAGGIGVTPLLCMAEQLATTGCDFQMHYCTRSLDRTAFLERITGSAWAEHVHFHFDDGDTGQKFDLKKLLASPIDGFHLYACGPKGFMDAVLGTARALGWPEDQLHYEFFAADATKSGDDASFEVKLASSGKVVVVPSDRSVTQALADVGIEIPISCEQGICSTCLPRVLDGEPDHRDLYLSPDEQGRNIRIRCGPAS
jgi:vanillate O-demethylase ferredoxin subunit